ncbi:MAG: YutD family protein [Tenericutes bacterium]|nr:YutD family protein [Mycoplasmatota bacterium]
MKIITINDVEYEITKDENNSLNIEGLKNKCTDYFVKFDYILGDYAYNNLRLKGFFNESNPNCKTINNIKYIEDYIKNYCAYGANYFVLKKIKKEVKSTL